MKPFVPYFGNSIQRQFIGKVGFAPAWFHTRDLIAYSCSRVGNVMVKSEHLLRILLY